MKRNIPVLILIALLASISAFANAWADGHDGRRGSDWGHRDDRGGHWEGGRHDGHLGWLWTLGSAVLLYNVLRPAPVAQPPALIMQTPQPQPAPARAYWYFCPSADAYYPYVQTCPSGWQQVPATPPPSD